MKPVLFPVMLGAPSIVTSFSFVQGSSNPFMVSHTHTQKEIFPVDVPYKLLRLASFRPRQNVLLMREIINITCVIPLSQC